MSLFRLISTYVFEFCWETPNTAEDTIFKLAEFDSISFYWRFKIISILWSLAINWLNIYRIAWQWLFSTTVNFKSTLFQIKWKFYSIHAPTKTVSLRRPKVEEPPSISRASNTQRMHWKTIAFPYFKNHKATKQRSGRERNETLLIPAPGIGWKKLRVRS